MKKLSAVIAAAAFSLTMATALANTPNNTPQSQEIVIKNAYVAATAQGQDSTEIYMDLDNNGPENCKLVSANSPVANETQLHKTVLVNGLPQMQQLRIIDIKPKHDDDLQPGGLHVMLIGLNKPLKTGDNVPLTLIFSDGSSLGLTVPVK